MPQPTADPREPLDARELQALVELARRHEAVGEADAAVASFVRAGAHEEAVRVLSAQRRFLEAAAVAMAGVGVPPEHVGRLDAAGRRLALLAAVCFGRGGQLDTAVIVLGALGEHERAAALLERAGDRVGAARLRAHEAHRRAASGPATAQRAAGAPGRAAVGGAPVTLEVARRFEAQGQVDLAVEAYVHLRRPGEAGRVAEQAGRPAAAAQLYADAGLAFEAARAYVAAGDTGRAIENWVCVSQSDARYRQACVELLRLAAMLGRIDVQMDSFLGRFRKEGPRDAREREALYLLARLYEGADLLEDAKDVLQQLAALPGGFRDAAALLGALQRRTAQDPSALERAVREDVAFAQLGGPARSPGGRRDPAPLEELPDLPELPPLPAASPRPAARPSRPSSPPAPLQLTEPALGAEGLGAGASRRPEAPTEEELLGQTRLRGGQARAPATALAAAGGVASESLPAPGQSLGQRYRILRELGRGGMAVVYEAQDEELGERVALKLFLLQQDADALSRFRQELKLTRQLTHPNVARLYDIGVHEGRRFISMELLEGSDLRALLAGPLPVPRALHYLKQATLGLAAAHRAGVVHRDVKPENLFVTRADALKLMDFGIAKGQQVSTLTMQGSMGGTPGYMSPDQITGFSAVTPAADQYSLGVVAFELLTGRLPFQHAEVMPLLMLHVQAAPPAVRALAPHVPEALERVVARLLAKRPEQRFPSCDALYAALEALGG